jgi:hypothetical protein
MSTRKRYTVLSLTIALTLVAAASMFAFLRSGQADISADTTGTTATISATTSASDSQEIGQEFSVSIVVDGGGQSFTSFGASVSTSNLTVVSLTKGGSVSNWTTEPSASSLNFFGAVAGQTSNVTVYTIVVKGQNAGAASITISNGAVKSTDGYTITDIFGSAGNGSYTISSPVVVGGETDPADQPTSNTSVAVNKSTSSTATSSSKTSSTAADSSVSTATEPDSAQIAQSTTTASDTSTKTTTTSTKSENKGLLFKILSLGLGSIWRGLAVYSVLIIGGIFSYVFARPPKIDSGNEGSLI